MSAPAISTTTVEDIDLTPVCETKHHGPDRPRADFWVEIHGCREMYACAPCLAKCRQGWVYALRKFGVVVCRRCEKSMTSFEQMYTRVVLLP